MTEHKKKILSKKSKSRKNKESKGEYKILTLEILKYEILIDISISSEVRKFKYPDDEGKTYNYYTLIEIKSKCLYPEEHKAVTSG